MSRKKEVQCKLNKLLVCSNPMECKQCGWYESEIRRRKQIIKEQGLTRSASGKWFLSLKKGDE